MDITHIVVLLRKLQSWQAFRLYFEIHHLLPEATRPTQGQDEHGGVGEAVEKEALRLLAAPRSLEIRVPHLSKGR